MMLVLIVFDRFVLAWRFGMTWRSTDYTAFGQPTVVAASPLLRGDVGEAKPLRWRIVSI